MFGNLSALSWLLRQSQSGNPGLLGYQQPQYGGLLGAQNTENLMQQYLQNLFMRRYNPPAIQQQPGMVGSQMGQGGMQYQAPQIANVPLPKSAGQSWASAYGPQYNQDGTWNFNSGFGSPG